MNKKVTEQDIKKKLNHITSYRDFLLIRKRKDCVFEGYILTVKDCCGNVLFQNMEKLGLYLNWVGTSSKEGCIDVSFIYEK